MTPAVQQLLGFLRQRLAALGREDLIRLKLELIRIITDEMERRDA